MIIRAMMVSRRKLTRRTVSTS